MWINFNNNPVARRVSDCAIRAVSLALDISWEDAYALLAAAGYAMGDLPNSNEVITAVLRQHGFYRRAINCQDCYTVSDFCRDHPYGVFVLFTSGHVVTCINGDNYDLWDSSGESILFYCYRKDDL